MSERGLYGLIGSFASPEKLADAARQLRSLGFRQIEAYNPYPIDGLDELLHPGRRIGLLLVIALGALFGAVWGYFYPILGRGAELSDQCRRPPSQ